MNKNTIIILATVIITLLVGLSGGYWLANSRNSNTESIAGKDASEPKILFWRNPMNPAITSPVFTKDDMGMDYIAVYEEKEETTKNPEVLFWRNPMNPAITSPVFTKDEMGMDYIAVYADTDKSAAEEPSGMVKIDSTTVQNIGVRIAPVTRRNLSRIVRAVGRVDYDEQRIARLHPKIEGWVEALNVEKTGERVRKNTILLSIYSPQLVATQQEYLLALNNYTVLKDSPFTDIRKGAKELLASAKERLSLLDVPDHQIEEIEKTHSIKKNLHIHSPFTGIVVKLGVSQGQYITPKNELYMIADLSKVWVYVDVYEDELPWIKIKDQADMTVAAAPGRKFLGKVSYIYPYLESKTRTVKVRLEFDNRDRVLKPDMFAEVNLHADRQIDAIVIPTEAVVRSGNREQVFVARGEGKFEPRDVRLGVSANGLTQILEGLTDNEMIVTSSQFLIDSESKLREATAKFMDTAKSNKQKNTATIVDTTQTMDMSDLDMEDMNLDSMVDNDLDMSTLTMDNINKTQKHDSKMSH